MTEPMNDAITEPVGSVVAQPERQDGHMRPEDAKILDRYRTLSREAEAKRAKVKDVKDRIRQQMHRISGLDTQAREARSRYDEALRQHVAHGEHEYAGAGNKEEVAKLEGDLAEARGIFRGLETELPRLEAAIPNDAEMERARREAWGVVARHLESKVPKEINEFAAKIYAAMLNHHPNVGFAAALIALCPVPPGRQRCSELAERLSKEYDIPVE